MLTVSRPSARQQGTQRVPTIADKSAEPDRNRFGGKMEERFRRRFEQD